MQILGLNITWERKSTFSLDQLIQRLDAIHQTVSGVDVNPETAMESPTVHSIVRGISNRIATLPIHVYRKTTSSGRESKELLPNHPVARLLSRPNDTQDRVTFWLDATSWLVRYGNFYAYKSRGQTGPIRRLESLVPPMVSLRQETDGTVSYRVTRAQGDQVVYTRSEVLHARGQARNGIQGDSPVMDARESIALEIAAERFGASFFGNGAMPFMIFKYVAGSMGFKTDEERRRFVEEFQEAYGQKRRFKALLLPRGIETGDPIPLDNEKAQFLETRKHQRSVIAAAFGVSPYFVGDFERATFSNVEQQSLDTITTVVLPYVRLLEAAMERDLLTDDDRAGGVIIRFNVDAGLRGEFLTRQKGLQIQRTAGAINANEWREREGMNPRPGGETYWDQGPSGQQPSGAQPAKAPTEKPDDDDKPPTNGKGTLPAGVLVEDR